MVDHGLAFRYPPRNSFTLFLEPVTPDSTKYFKRSICSSVCSFGTTVDESAQALFLYGVVTSDFHVCVNFIVITSLM
jgi:hypothetical protein